MTPQQLLGTGIRLFAIWLARGLILKSQAFARRVIPEAKAVGG